jgi:hypothetical protein
VKLGDVVAHDDIRPGARRGALLLTEAIMTEKPEKREERLPAEAGI